MRGILFTDGAKYVADQGGAYWLIDEIAIAQRFEKAVKGEEFQVWKLTVNPDRSARLLCEDGNGHTVFEKAIEYTDFPADGIELWFENSTIYPGLRRGRLCRASAERYGEPHGAALHLPTKKPDGANHAELYRRIPHRCRLRNSRLPGALAAGRAEEGTCLCGEPNR